jgi:ATP-dependent RNA helicase RhlE
LTQFTDLGLAEPIMKALESEGYNRPTPIQSEAIPALMAGRDLLGTAQTGTGKTAAFTLPVLDAIVKSKSRAQGKSCTALILAPTRELALQIAESVKTYGRFVRPSVAVVMGGVKPGGQIRTMQRGVDVLIATPGRLLDHMNTGAINLQSVKTVILDEADQMMDLGFLPGIRKILAATPQERQTALLSATMPKPIRALAHDFLTDPVQISVAPVSRPIEQIEQSVQFLDRSQKLERLVKVLQAPEMRSGIVFTRTKRGADKVAQRLDKAGIVAAAIHGNKSQNQRQRALDAFKNGKCWVLVATDIAARGIDIDGVSHVVNYELPNVPESYVHRIGRTARAGSTGVAVAFCDPEERGLLKDIERLIGYRLAVTDEKGEIEHPSKPFTEEPRGPKAGGKPNNRGHRNKPRQPRPEYRGDDQRNREAVTAEAGPEQPRAEHKADADGEFRQRSDKPRPGKPHGRPGQKFRGKKPGGHFQGDRAKSARPDGDRKSGERRAADHARDDRPQGERKQGERNPGGRPQGKPARDERGYSDRPKSGKPGHKGAGKPHKAKAGNDNRRRDGNKTGLDRMLDGSGGIRRRNSRPGGPNRRSA